VAEEDIYLSAAGEKLEPGALDRGRPVPAAIGPTPPHGKRTAVGETAQAAEPEACSGGQVMEAEAQRHRPGSGCVRAGAGERLGVVVVSVHEQKLEPRTTEQSTGGAKEAAPFQVARQVAEVAEGDERVAALLDGALDQVAQVASVAMHVAEDEQTAHSPRLPRLCSFVERVPRRCKVPASTGVEAILWPVLESARELLADPSRIKECEGEECGWVFVDATKSGTRRWCSMASCGARAKMKRYRARPQRSRSS
jgi:predicted RNA-binding Zn ribbon-like protein